MARRALSLLSSAVRCARRIAARRFRLSRTRATVPYTISVWTDPDSTDDGTAAGRFWVTVRPAGGTSPLPRATRVSVSLASVDRPGEARAGAAAPIADDPAQPLRRARHGSRGPIPGPRGNRRARLEPPTTEADVDATYDLRPAPALIAVYLAAVPADWISLDRSDVPTAAGSQVLTRIFADRTITLIEITTFNTKTTKTRRPTKGTSRFRDTAPAGTAFRGGWQTHGPVENTGWMPRCFQLDRASATPTPARWAGVPAGASGSRAALHDPCDPCNPCPAVLIRVSPWSIRSARAAGRPPQLTPRASMRSRRDRQPSIGYQSRRVRSRRPAVSNGSMARSMRSKSAARGRAGGAPAPRARRIRAAPAPNCDARSGENRAQDAGRPSRRTVSL